LIHEVGAFNVAKVVIKGVDLGSWCSTRNMRCSIH
jgi:hypothetical protein